MKTVTQEDFVAKEGKANMWDSIRSEEAEEDLDVPPTLRAKFRKKKVFSTLADAVAWLDALANISGNVQGLTLSSSAISIAIAGTSTLTPTSVPGGASASNVTWSSADASIATVSDAGVVTGVAAGTTVVSPHYGAIVANCRVTVTAT